MAQTTPATPQPNGNHGQATGETLRAQVRSNLQQAGFSDVKIMPDSFLVQAKDKSGNPVSMIINPNSVTEVVDMAAGSQAASSGAQSQNGGFLTLPQTGEEMGSKVIGLDVKGADSQTIGTIKDLAYQGSQLQAYVLSADGHYVAVAPSALHVSYDANAQAWHATMNATEAQLKAAPHYDYSSAT